MLNAPHLTYSLLAPILVVLGGALIGVLVEAFLNDRIKFYEMAGLLHTVLDMNFSGAANQIEDIVQCDTEVRKKTLELLNAVN